jgi:hypothetical protein
MLGYVAAYVHSFCRLFFVERHVDMYKLPDDDQLMIETFWSDFKYFNV